jgi:hypothetical protein
MALQSKIIILFYSLRNDCLLSIYFQEFLHKVEVVKFWKISSKM